MAQLFNRPDELIKIANYANLANYEELAARMTAVERQDVRYENTPGVGAIDVVGQVKAVLVKLDELTAKQSAAQASGTAGVKREKYEKRAEIEYFGTGAANGAAIGCWTEIQSLKAKLGRLLGIVVNTQAQTVKQQCYNSAYRRYF
jgi:hypothetical protein